MRQRWNHNVRLAAVRVDQDGQHLILARILVGQH